MGRPKVICVEEAVRLIKDGDLLAVNGFGSVSHPEAFTKELERQFLEHGSPRNLSFFAAAGQGVFNPNEMFDRLALDGLMKRMFTGHFGSMVSVGKMVTEEKIEGYNYPLGVMCHLLRATAGRKPGILSKVGLHTFIDPRHGGGRMNSISKDTWVELMEIKGEEYLFYTMPAVNIGLIRGTTADPNGNITMEKEPTILDALAIAHAAHAHDGIVIVQVERLSSNPAHPHDVVIPGLSVDYIYTDPTQKMSFMEHHNPTCTGELRAREEDIPEIFAQIDRLIDTTGRGKSLVHRLIASRAAREMQDGYSANFGIGIPELVMDYVDRTKIKVNTTVEAGALGGHPSRGLSFGAAVNVEAIIDQGANFDFYDSGKLDITFLGAIEIDSKGNINASRMGKVISGVGGFINLSQNAQHVVFCAPFSVKGLEVDFDGEKVSIKKEGSIMKFSSEVQQISFNGDYALERNQKVIYVTERCVFYLEKGGLTLAEVAPGIDVERDILRHLPFTPRIAEPIKPMCFNGLDAVSGKKVGL